MAPALGLGFQERVMDVRVTSVTSGLEGALGIRFGSVGLFGWTGTPNSVNVEQRKKIKESCSLLLFPSKGTQKNKQKKPSCVQYYLSHFNCSFTSRIRIKHYKHNKQLEICTLAMTK